MAETQGGPRVVRWNGPAASAIEIEASLRRRLAELGYAASRYVYPPGTRFPPHTHAVDKMDAVVAGTFRLTLMGAEVTLGAGDMIEVPHGVVHDAEVVGNEPVVSLDGVRFQRR